MDLKKSCFNILKYCNNYCNVLLCSNNYLQYSKAYMRDPSSILWSKNVITLHWWMDFKKSCFNILKYCNNYCNILRHNEYIYIQ